LGSFSWTLRIVEVLVLGQSGILLKEQGSHGLDVSLRGIKGLTKRPVASELKGLQPIYNSILFYFILIGKRLEDIAGTQAGSQVALDSITKLEFQRCFQQWEM
jgi:hypothetical protein